MPPVAVAPALPRLLTLNEVAAMMNRRPGTIWRWRKEGKFPQPLKIGGWATSWKRSDIIDFLERSKQPESIGNGE